MQYTAKTFDEYLNQIPKERRKVFTELRNTIISNLPKGFSEVSNYGMIGYAVPHSIYPKGYHCKPTDPLPFMGIASQKHFIALYHLGIYMDKNLMKWFVDNYKLQSRSKLDMGKSCIRFKKIDEIPFKLIAELCKKVTVKQFIDCYEKALSMR